MWSMVDAYPIISAIAVVICGFLLKFILGSIFRETESCQLFWGLRSHVSRLNKDGQPEYWFFKRLIAEHAESIVQEWLIPICLIVVLRHAIAGFLAEHMVFTGTLIIYVIAGSYFVLWHKVVTKRLGICWVTLPTTVAFWWWYALWAVLFGPSEDSSKNLQLTSIGEPQ